MRLALGSGANILVIRNDPPPSKEDAPMRLFQFAVTLGIVALGTLPGIAQADPADAEIVTIRPAATTGTKQGLPIFQGISGQNAGAKHISMNKVIIPPGGAAKAHVHKGYESAIYLIKGRVETLYGEDLEEERYQRSGRLHLYPRRSAA